MNLACTFVACTFFAAHLQLIAEYIKEEIHDGDFDRIRRHIAKAVKTHADGDGWAQWSAVIKGVQSNAKPLGGYHAVKDAVEGMIAAEELTDTKVGNSRFVRPGARWSND